MDNDYVLDQKELGLPSGPENMAVTWSECEHISVVLRERAKELLHTVARPAKRRRRRRRSMTENTSSVFKTS